jgi:hypothetical protein
VQAVGRIQFQPAFTAVVINLDFIHITRTKPGAGAAVFGITGVYTKIGVVHDNMGRLIFAMFGLGQVNAGEFVHIQLSIIDFRINSRLNLHLLAVERLE